MSGTYALEEVTQCAMCFAPLEQAKVLGRRLNASQGARPTRRVGVTTTVMRCGSCGLVFPNPLPVPADIGQHYDMDPEVYWHPRNLQAPPDYFGPQIRARPDSTPTASNRLPRSGMRPSSAAESIRTNSG